LVLTLNPCFHDSLNLELLKASKPFLHRPQRVLEIGCHDGRLTHQIIKHYNPKLLVTSDIKQLKKTTNPNMVVCNGEQLPFKSPQFDWIASGGTFQWFSTQWQSISKMHSALKPNGICSFTQFIDNSMEPLSGVLSELGWSSRLLALTKQHDFKIDLKKEDWTVLHFKTISGEDHFNNTLDLFKHLRKIGATQSKVGDAMTLALYRQLNKKMEQYRTKLGIPLFWQAVVVVLMRR